MLYILDVKVILTLVFMLLVFRVEAQVSFRSDIMLGKHAKKSGLGISFITVALGPRWGGMPGTGRQTLIIDLKALKYSDQTYTYRQLAERVYGLIPGIPAGHYPQPIVPLFLLVEPPKDIQRPIPTVRVRR